MCFYHFSLIRLKNLVLKGLISILWVKYIIFLIFFNLFIHEDFLNTIFNTFALYFHGYKKFIEIVMNKRYD